MFLLYLLMAAGLVAGTIYIARLATETDEPGVIPATPVEEGVASLVEVEEEVFPELNPSTGLPFSRALGGIFGPDVGGYMIGEDPR